MELERYIFTTGLQSSGSCDGNVKAHPGSSPWPVSDAAQVISADYSESAGSVTDAEITVKSEDSPQAERRCEAPRLSALNPQQVTFTDKEKYFCKWNNLR